MQHIDQYRGMACADFSFKDNFSFKKIIIKKDYDENLPVVSCERAKIQQVFLNLLRNGAQAMQEAGVDKPQFTIRTGIEKKRNMAFIEIEDNGTGINEDDRKKIFEPFFTTKPAGVGTGLGLSVSNFIITKNHGGEMAIESKPGEWTKFIVRLPV